MLSTFLLTSQPTNYKANSRSICDAFSPDPSFQTTVLWTILAFLIRRGGGAGSAKLWRTGKNWIQWLLNLIKTDFGKDGILWWKWGLFGLVDQIRVLKWFWGHYVHLDFQGLTWDFQLTCYFQGLAWDFQLTCYFQGLTWDFQLTCYIQGLAWEREIAETLSPAPTSGSMSGLSCLCSKQPLDQ